KTSPPTMCASMPRSCGPTRPTRPSCMSACSRAIWNGRAKPPDPRPESAPGALQGLIGLPLLDTRDIVAGKGLRVLARTALDPGEDQALRPAGAVLPGLEQHLARDRGAHLGVAVVVDRRPDLADRAAGRLAVGVP